MLKKFLKDQGLIAEEPNSTSPDPAPTAAPIEQKRTMGSVPASFTPTATAVNTGDPNPEIVGALNAEIGNVSNKAYDEFHTFYDTLDGLPDSQRIGMALKLLAKQGVDGMQVVASLDERFARLDAADADAHKTLEGAVAEQVTGVAAQIDTLDQEIENLKNEIRQRETDKATLTRQRAENEIALDAERATYEASSEVVRKSLADEKERILRHINSTKPSTK